MRRIHLRRRRKRNRLSRAYEWVTVRALAIGWLVRMFVRHGRPTTR